MANSGNGKAMSVDGKDLQAAIADWQESSAMLRGSMDDLFATLKGAGFN